MTKSRGPRTEPWGTPQRDEMVGGNGTPCGEEKSLHLTRKQREENWGNIGSEPV